MPNRMSISIPDELWHKLVDVQAFKQKQTLSSVSMSDIIVGILRDTIEHSSYYQGILTGKFTPERERAPTMKERTNMEGGVSCQSLRKGRLVQARAVAEEFASKFKREGIVGGSLSWRDCERTF